MFEPRFSAHSYACRKGKGTHAAVEAARRGAHNHEFAFKGDVMKYFASIDHEILLEQLARAVKCKPTIALAASIIAGWEDQRIAASYFEGDDLFTPHERRRGLPLGNQTSQFFANVYLTPLDVLIEQELRPARYARYVDDFLLFGNCKSELNEMRARIEESLAAVRLRIHPGKSRAYRTRDGVSFLGWIVFPERVRLDRGNAVRARRRLRTVERAYAEGRLPWPAVEARFRGWLAHAAHGDTWRLRTETMARYNLTTRSAV